MPFKINPFSRALDYYFKPGSGAAIKSPLIIEGDTNDGSTLIINAKDSDGASVFTVDTEGFSRIEYRDEYPSAPWAFPQGVAAPDEVDLTSNGVTTRGRAFDGGSTVESLTAQFEIQHDTAVEALNVETVKMEMHVHVRPMVNDATPRQGRFEVLWEYGPPNAAPVAMDTQVILVTIPSNSQYWNLLGGVEPPIPTGGYKIGSIISATLRRTPAHTDDTYGSDLFLTQFALHVPVNGDGSRQRYIR